MNSIIKKIIARLRMSMFPTEHDKEIRRWWSDGGLMVVMKGSDMTMNLVMIR